MTEGGTLDRVVKGNLFRKPPVELRPHRRRRSQTCAASSKGRQDAAASVLLVTCLVCTQMLFLCHWHVTICERNCSVRPGKGIINIE